MASPSAFASPSRFSVSVHHTRMSSCSSPVHMFGSPLLDNQMGSMVLSQNQMGSTVPLIEPTFEAGTDESEGDHLSVPETIFNLFNTVVGVGVLSVPFAFRLSGFWTLAILIAVITITSLTGKYVGAALMLAAKSPEATDVPPSSRDYAFLGFVAFGDRGRALVAAVTCLETWFALCTFVVMSAVNACLVWPELDRTTAVVAGSLLTACASFVPMRFFSYLSLISSFALLCAAVAMVVTGFLVRSWAEPYEHAGMPYLSVLANVPRSFGLLIFCFAGHPCFPMIHEAMREQVSWNPSVNVTFLLAFLFYGSLGLYGYDVFGSLVDPSFTENLAAVPGAGIWRTVTLVSFLVKIQLTAPLLLKVTMMSLWAPDGPTEWPPGRILAFGVLVVFTVIVSVAFADDVGALASLTGSLFVMATSVVFPTLVYMRLQRDYGRGRAGGLDTILQGCLVAFGCAMAVAGTASAFQDLLTP